MHTSLSKKLLAGLLSLVMVLSLVAPGASAQAATKYSLTDKKSVKSGVTFKYELKGVSKGCYVKVTRNVSGEKVVYNHKELTKTTKINGTGKTLNLYVTYGEKDENYTGKFTVKVYGKKTNKCYKTLVETVTVKVPEKEAVTSVAINNTTPKVGDTLSVVTTPESASIVSYEWKAGSDVVGKAATYTVTTAELGKTITVTVTDALGNVKASEATAAVTDTALEIVSAEQTGANTVKVVMNKAITKDDVVTLTKGTEAQTITAELDAENKEISITTANKIVSAKYTVTVTPKDTAIKAASKELQGAVQALEGLKFGNELVLGSASDFYVAYATLCGVDQWGNEFAISKSKLTGLYASTANTSVDYNAAYRTVTITKTSGTHLPFNLGEKVTLTAVYQDGSTVLNQTAELTVSNAAYVTDMTFGELTTETAALKDKAVTVENFYNGKYYLPVVAKDQYGNVMSAKTLNAAVSGNGLFVTPSAAQCVYAGFDSFDTIDGKTVMRVNSKSNSLPGKAEIVISALGGYSTSVSFEIVSDSYIDGLDVEVPGSLFGGEAAELSLSAVDQDNNTVDVYKYFDKTNSTATLLRFKDQNRGLGNTYTSVAISGGTFKYETSLSKKTLKVYVVPTAANTPVVITTTTASMKVSSKTYAVGYAGTLHSIDTKLVTGTNTTIEKTHGTFDFMKAAQFVDSNGEVVNYKSDKFPAYASTPVTTDGVYSWNVKKASGSADDDGVIDTITADTKYTVSLYVGDGSQANLVDSDDYTIHVATPDENGDFESYELKISAVGSALLNATHDGNAKGSNSVIIDVYGVDKNGNKAILASDSEDDSYTLQVSNEIVNTYTDTDNEIKSGSGSCDAVAAATSAATLVKGELTVTLWNKSGEAKATVKVPYSNEKAKAVGIVYYATKAIANNATKVWYPAAGDEITLTNTVKDVIWNDGKLVVRDLASGTTVAANGDIIYTMYVCDQYDGVVSTGTELTAAGKLLTANASAQDSTDYNGKTLRMSNGSLLQDIIINR